MTLAVLLEEAPALGVGIIARGIGEDLKHEALIQQETEACEIININSIHAERIGPFIDQGFQQEISSRNRLTVGTSCGLIPLGIVLGDEDVSVAHQNPVTAPYPPRTLD